jgi:ribosomal protein L14
MAFQRIGNPVNLEMVNFKKTATVTVCCAKCKAKVGRRNGQFIKFANSPVVVVSPEKFVCPKCGTVASIRDEVK